MLLRCSGIFQVSFFSFWFSKDKGMKKTVTEIDVSKEKMDCCVKSAAGNLKEFVAENMTDSIKSILKKSKKRDESRSVGVAVMYRTHGSIRLPAELCLRRYEG
jgi:hypothetical protein